jgi:arylsulfatase A-like enzyme
MPMSNGAAVVEEIVTAGAPAPCLEPPRLRPRHVFIVSVWCSLVAGLLEVGVIVLRTHTIGPNHFYWMSRQFVWLIPLTNLLIVVALGLVSATLALCWPRRGSWLAARLLCTLTLLPVLWAGWPGIYGPAGLILALGIAARLVPVLERRPAGWRRCLRVSFPALVAVTPLLAAGIWARDRLQDCREQARPLPAPGSANVLLIVLDTVAADHLSLHGYARPTCPTLDGLARRGIRFDRVQATSSWTLPSHASAFTGRWPHELSAGWLTPLDGTHPTLAEYLATRGYATAGFVANLFYCGADTGLGRGFTTYRDYIFRELSAFKMAALIHRPVEGLRAIDDFLSRRIDTTFFQGLLLRFDAANRKPAAVVNREFLDWLSRRRQPDRPFFAFLNYFDVHYPYKLSGSGIHRFGVRPRTRREIELIERWRTVDKLKLSAGEIAFVRNSYDDCIADLDEQLGCLIDELERRAILERTWLVITSDHGESFGEQPGIFSHGTSLYQPQLHVPMVIVSPARSPSPSTRVISETVSLRDVPATVLDVLGLGAGAPFPGASLARLWGHRSPPDPIGPGAADASPALSEVIPTDPLDQDPAHLLEGRRGVWASLAAGDAIYLWIWQRGAVHEALFDLRADPNESLNLAAEEAQQPVLERMRAALDRLTAGPLTPERFRP